MEMFRVCERVNHEFRCPAGEARFAWLIKHTMVASVNEFPRLVITKDIAGSLGTEVVCFAIMLYATENALPEHYILKMDEHMACSLTKTEQKTSVAEMSQRFFDMLCTSSTDRKLVESVSTR